MKKGNNFFTDISSLKTIDSLRILYACIAVLFFIITELGRKVYRPYIYSNDINDLGIADSIGNLGGVVVQIFFSLAILNSPKNKTFRVILFIILGYILYEILQPYLPRGVFDWLDIYGTILGGIVSILILYSINRIVKNTILYTFK